MEHNCLKCNKKMRISNIIALSCLLALFSCNRTKPAVEDYIAIKQAEKDSLNHLEESKDDNRNDKFNILVDEYENVERSDWQNPSLVLQKLGDIRGKTVADIGAGTGYFTFPLARIAKSVIAIDIDERFIHYIDDRKLEYDESVSNNIHTRLTQENDPGLDDGEVDAVLIVNVYHFLTNRVRYLGKLKHGLKQGGVIVIVDFKKGDLPVGPQDIEKEDVERVTGELLVAGFEIIEIDENSLDYQYIIKAHN